MNKITVAVVYLPSTINLVLLKWGDWNRQEGQKYENSIISQSRCWSELITSKLYYMWIWIFRRKLMLVIIRHLNSRIVITCKDHSCTPNIPDRKNIIMPVTWSSVTSILQRRKTSFITFIYYIDTDEIPGFFLLLKNHIFIAHSQDTIFIFHMWGYWCHHGIFLFFIRILTFWNRKYKYYCLYFSFITLYPSFVTTQ